MSLPKHPIPSEEVKKSINHVNITKKDSHFINISLQQKNKTKNTQTTVKH